MEGVKEQLQVIRKRVPFLLDDNAAWPYRERRESLRSLRKTNGTIGSNENSCENDDNCG